MSSVKTHVLDTARGKRASGIAVDLERVSERPEHVASGVTDDDGRVISVAAFGLALHSDRQQVRTGIESVAPTPRRAYEAETFLAAALDDAGLWESRGELPQVLADEFGRQVSAAGSPIDDVRGTAAYRLHSPAVMARRSPTWACEDYRRLSGIGKD